MLSGIGIINISFSEIVYFLLITSGIGLVYIGSENKTSIIIFSGTALFLMGVLLLTNLNFNVKIEQTDYVTIALLITATGLLMVFINNADKKVILVTSLILFATSLTLVITQTNFKLDRFLFSVKQLFNIYWPVILICILIVGLLRHE